MSARDLAAENADLRPRLAEAEQALQAIRSGTAGVLSDTAERLRADAAVSRGQKTFFDLVERAPFGIYVIDSQFRIAQMNSGSQKGAFRNVRPVIGRPFDEAMRILWPEPVAAEIIAHFRRTLETGESFFSPRFISQRHDVETLEAYEWELHRLTLPDGQYGVVCYYVDSTKPRMAEQALRESESRYRAIGESIDYGVWVCAPDGRNIYASPSFLKLVGITQEQCSNFGWGDVLHPEDAARTIAAWQECVHTEGKWDIEHRFRGVDGKYHPVLARGVPVRNEKGDIVCWAGINLDISRLRETEESLRTSEERHRLLAETMLQGVVHQDADGKIIAMNPAAERILGKSREEFLGSSSVQEEHHTIRENGQPFPGVEHPAMVALRTGQEVHGTIMGVFNPKIGAYRWISIDAVPMFHPGETHPAEVYTVFEDITERKRAEEAQRKRAEEALRMSEEEFRSLAEAVPQIVWATRPDGWNIFFNQQWVDYTGMTMDESYGHGWNTPFHPEDKQRAWEAWQRATQHNERYSLECRLRRADGAYRWWLIRGEPMRGANGEILKWFGTCTDIEDLKRAERALQEAKDLLEQRVAERTAALQASEQRFRLALKNAPVSVALQDRNLVYQWAYNQRTRRPDEIVGKTDADLFAPEDVRGILETKRRVLESGTEAHVQHWLTSNGVRLFLDIYYEPTRDSAGEINGIGIAVVDLTKQKQAEDELRLSEAKFAQAFASNPAAISLSRLEDGLVLEVNDTWVALSGYCREEVIGRSARTMGIWPSPEAAQRFVAKLKENGSVRGWEQEFRKKSGELYVAQLSAQILEVQGETAVLSTLVDITEQKRLQDALRFVGERAWGLSGEDFFHALARYLAQNLGADFVCIDRLEEGSLAAQTVAVFCDGAFQDNVNYALKDTLCGDVVGKNVCCFPGNVRGLFPEDAVLQELRAEGYVGTTLWGAQGKPIGLIALIWRSPLADTRLPSAILQLVAVRAAGELERRQAEAALRDTNSELARFNQAMVGRELRMIELKEEINTLCIESGRPPRYAPQTETPAT
jgi:PAS domain S-box-containing protein